MSNTAVSTLRIKCASLIFIFLLAHTNATAESNTVAEIAQTPFEVSYQAKLMGTKLTAESGLQQLETGEFEYHYNTSSMLGKATEKSRFALADAGQLMPLAYRYKLAAMGVKKRITLAFDWPAGRVSDRAAKPQWTMELPSGALDPLSMQLQLRSDVMHGETQLTYAVIRNGRIKEYHFDVEAEEIIDTHIGPLRTLRIKRDRGDDSEKFTMIWLAVDWSYLIAKIRDGKVDGGHQEVVLAGGSIDGARITALQQ